MRLEAEHELELTQVAFSAYLDTAMDDGGGQAGRERGMRAAVLAVADRLETLGYVREPLTAAAVHGSRSGYQAGCRCQYCIEAGRVEGRARHYWSAQRGHNKVLPEDT